MTRIWNPLPKMAAGCFSIHCSITPTVIQRSHSPEALRRLSKATSEMAAMFPCFALTAVSLSEHPLARWISKVLSRASALSNLRHRLRAPSFLAPACHPIGRNFVSTCQSSSSSSHCKFSIVTPVDDYYIKPYPRKSTIKLALMPARGEEGLGRGSFYLPPPRRGRVGVGVSIPLSPVFRLEDKILPVGFLVGAERGRLFQ